MLRAAWVQLRDAGLGYMGTRSVTRYVKECGRVAVDICRTDQENMRGIKYRVSVLCGPNPRCLMHVVRQSRGASSGSHQYI